MAPTFPLLSRQTMKIFLALESDWKVSDAESESMALSCLTSRFTRALDYARFVLAFDRR
jgi:hypothetical protein